MGRPTDLGQVLMKNKIRPSLPCKKCLKTKADADDDGIIHLVVGEDSKVGDILPLKGSRQVHVVLRGETNFYFGPKNRACIIALNVINSMVLKKCSCKPGHRWWTLCYSLLLEQLHLSWDQGQGDHQEIRREVKKEKMFKSFKWLM